MQLRKVHKQIWFAGQQLAGMAAALPLQAASAGTARDTVVAAGTWWWPAHGCSPSVPLAVALCFGVCLKPCLMFPQLVRLSESAGEFLELNQ